MYEKEFKEAYEPVPSPYADLVRLVFIRPMDIHLLQLKVPGNKWVTLIDITSEVFVNMLLKNQVTIQGESENKAIERNHEAT